MHTCKKRKRWEKHISRIVRENANNKSNYRTFLYPEENQKANITHMNNTHPTVWQGILNAKQNKINPESKHWR
jgi:hypothetical protein